MKQLLTAAAALSLSACASSSGPPATIALTEPFTRTVPTDPGGLQLGAWWRGFRDPLLVGFVERAAAQNLDVAQAAARVGQARAELRASTATLLPQLGAQAAASDVSQSLLSPIGRIGSRVPGFERSYEDYSLGGAASWEVDLFGGARAARSAAQSDHLSAVAAQEAVRITVQAEAADAYLQIRSLQARLAIARSQAEARAELARLVRDRVAMGVSADREARQAEAALEAVRATVPPLEASLEGQMNRLDVLMGQQPGANRRRLSVVAEIPEAPALSEALTPSDLIRRRPDLVAAEQRLKAASARVRVALSEYYPKVSLAGLLGSESLRSGDLLSSPARTSQATLGVRWRLFDFGRVNAEIGAAKGREAELLAFWQSTALRAAEEVEGSLAGIEAARSREAIITRQVEALRVVRSQAEQGYRAGAVDLIEVRQADEDLLAASDELVQARAAGARAAVQMFRALGGGWSLSRETAPAFHRSAS